MNSFTFTSMFTLLFSIFVLTGSGAFASPIALTKRDVYTPRIIDPWAKTVWVPGQTFNVTWDASDAPKQISNRASVTLQSDAEPKFGPVTLTQDFDLRSGITEVTVPADTPLGAKFFITLFGDSGDVSAVFAMEAQA